MLCVPQATYRLLVEMAVAGGQPHLAAQLCSEAHEGGAFAHFALPNLAYGLPPAGTALGNVVDLRGCSTGVGAAVLLTWLTRVGQMQALGLVVKDRCVKVITGEEGGGEVRV